MAITFAEAARFVRTEFAERGTFISDDTGNMEIKDAMQIALNELNLELRFLRDRTTINGSSYIASWGSNPFMYELPATFLAIDRWGGILQNGIHRLEASEAQYALQQEKAVGSPSTSGTITTTDFFEESFTGLVFHYFTRFVMKSEVDAGRSGFLAYFDPQLALTSTVEFSFICTHGDPTTLIYLPTQFKSLLTFKTCELLSMKFVSAGRCSPAVLNAFSQLAEQRLMAAKTYFDNKPQKPRIHCAKEIGMYNSALYHAGYGGRIVHDGTG